MFMFSETYYSKKGMYDTEKTAKQRKIQTNVKLKTSLFESKCN